MLALLKVLTIVATAVLGLIGSLATLRDHTGRITAHGWLVLAAVTITGLSAAGLQVYSEHQQELTTNALLTDINRTLHPLSGLKVSLSLRPDWKKPEFRAYIDKFNAGLDSADSFIAKSLTTNHLSASTMFGSTPVLRKDYDPLLHEALCAQRVDMLFYRTPIPPQTFKFDLSDSGEDLHIEVGLPCALNFVWTKESSVFESNLRWDFDRRDGTLHRLDLLLSDVAVDPTSDGWRSNAKITSLQDLLGAQLIVTLRTLGMVVPPNLADYERSIQLGRLLLRLPNGVVLRFDADNLVRFRDHDGFFAYAVTFPLTMAELIKVTHYDHFKELRGYADPL